MSHLSWVQALNETIHRLQKADKLPRVAVLGIGNELRGDDAAGVLIAKNLIARHSLSVDDQLASSHRPVTLVIEADTAPESCTGQLRHFHPDLVILLDAANMNVVPGTAHWLHWEDTVGLSASTHTLPPSVLGTYLVHEFGCEVYLLGIQPALTTIGMPPSLLVEKAIETITHELENSLALQTLDPSGCVE